MAAKVTDTVVAFSHAHNESDLFPKLNIFLHGQEMAERPALSVGESNDNKTVCPLSENLASTGSGAGTAEVEDSIFTLMVRLEYSVELDPEKRKPTIQSPVVLGLDDKTKYPFSDDTLVKSIDAGVVTTSFVGSPSSVMKGATMSVPQGALGSSYEKTKRDLLD